MGSVRGGFVRRIPQHAVVANLFALRALYRPPLP